MAPESRIFINDVILPDQGSPLLYALNLYLFSSLSVDFMISFAAFDITMLADLSAKERSETMWKRLISQVEGLEVRKFWQAPGLKGEGIVEVGRTT